MRTLEIRRHSLRKTTGGSQLSQDGVDLARRVGASMGPFAALAAVLRADGAYHRYAHSMAALWRDLVTPLSDGDAALVIGHSGELEAALVACFPDADHSQWGGVLGCCEGARLTFDDYFRAVEFLRLT